MVTKRIAMRAVAGFSLWAGVGSVAGAQVPAVTVEDAFKVQPRQPGVNVATPTPEVAAQCKVSPIPNPKDPKSPMGYVVRDAAGRTVRQFVSYDGKSFNIIAFYTEGVEAYREVYPPAQSEPYQFRWLGVNGSKWGLDKDRDGKIDEWVVMSPEELSQELLQAVLTNDARRAAALTVNKANLDALGLQGGEAQRVLDRAGGVPARVAKANAELKAPPTAEWMHLQLGVPQATPADAVGTREDLVFHKTGTVLVKDGAASKSFQTGEIVQVGRAWKLVDGPAVGSAESGGGPLVFPGVEPLIADLNKLDSAQVGGDAGAIAAHQAKRAAILEQIVAQANGQADAKIRETWTKLLLDSLSAAAEGEKLDGRHLARMKQFKEAFSGKPGPVGSYAWFHYLITENSIALRETTGGQQLTGVQEKWRASLEEFVKANPKADETAEATLRLGMAFEFMNTKDGDAKAKEWYEQLAKAHTGHPYAVKAAGAVKRLEAEGKPLEIAGTNLATGQPFNAAALKDKAVVVYYCANWSSTLGDDAKKLRALVKEYGSKGLELVIVNLDTDAKAATQTVAAHELPGTVLHAPGGLDGSPLAAQYGIIVVPHIFVAGKDGKVVNRNAQAANLDDEVKKLLP
ncbi:redoxin family protein [Gemmata sp.]|uniref:redoxin family protein n=1 Tax=Gemmata sp. TaxID=1914242 RepID=UPI003F70B0A8